MGRVLPFPNVRDLAPRLVAVIVYLLPANVRKSGSAPGRRVTSKDLNRSHPVRYLCVEAVQTLL
jgi:hypothetical protein